MLHNIILFAFSTSYFSTLILNRCSLDTFYQLICIGRLVHYYHNGKLPELFALYFQWNFNIHHHYTRTAQQWSIKTHYMYYLLYFYWKKGYDMNAFICFSTYISCFMQKYTWHNHVQTSALECSNIVGHITECTYMYVWKNAVSWKTKSYCGMRSVWQRFCSVYMLIYSYRIFYCFWPYNRVFDSPARWVQLFSVRYIVYKGVLHSLLMSTAPNAGDPTIIWLFQYNIGRH